MRLLASLASQPSPFKSLLTQCIGALRPCVFARAASTFAEVTPPELGAVASEDVTHMSVSVKLRVEVMER